MYLFNLSFIFENWDATLLRREGSTSLLDTQLNRNLSSQAWLCCAPCCAASALHILRGGLGLGWRQMQAWPASWVEVAWEGVRGGGAWGGGGQGPESVHLGAPLAP